MSSSQIKPSFHSEPDEQDKIVCLCTGRIWNVGHHHERQQPMTATYRNDGKDSPHAILYSSFKESCRVSPMPDFNVEHCWTKGEDYQSEHASAPALRIIVYTADWRPRRETSSSSQLQRCWISGIAAKSFPCNFLSASLTRFIYFKMAKSAWSKTKKVHLLYPGHMLSPSEGNQGMLTNTEVEDTLRKWCSLGVADNDIWIRHLQGRMPVLHWHFCPLIAGHAIMQVCTRSFFVASGAQRATVSSRLSLLEHIKEDLAQAASLSLSIAAAEASADIISDVSSCSHRLPYHTDYLHHKKISWLRKPCLSSIRLAKWGIACFMQKVKTNVTWLVVIG